MTRPGRWSGAAAALAIGGAAAVVSGDEGARTAVSSVLRTVMVDAEHADGSSLVVAPQSEHLAYRVETDAGTAWIVDGTAGKPFEQVGPIAFSGDGRRWAHFGRRGAEWLLVVDGEERPAGFAMLSETSLRFSPGGKHLAFQASRLVEGEPPGEVLVVDGVAGPPFAGGEYATIVLADSGMAAYVATDLETEFVVAGGKPGPRHPRGSISALALSADGRRHAYVMKTEEGQSVVADGKPGKTYSHVGPPTFAPAGSRLLHVAVKDGKVLVVVDGVEGTVYDDLSAPGPRFNPDGKHYAYAAKKGDAFLVVHDGIEGKSYGRLGGEHLRLSPDGTRTAYWAVEGPKAFFVVGGVEQPPADLVGTGASVCFSPDSKRVAYVAKKGKTWHVVTDGVDGPPLDGVGDAFPVFSPDSRRVVYQARVKGKWHLVVDRDLGPAFDAFAEGPMAFGHDGSTPACFARLGKRWSILVGGVGPGEEYAVVMPNQPSPAADGPASFHAWLGVPPLELRDVRVAAAAAAR